MKGARFYLLVTVILQLQEALESNYDDKFEFEAYNHSEQIKAQIQQFDLSGHADREQLVEYAKT